MGRPGQTAPSSDKLLGARGTKLRVAAVSAAVLGLGAWLAPPTIPTPLPAPQERPAPLLEAQVQLRDLPRPFRGVQNVAGLVRGAGAAIPYQRETRTRTLSDFSRPSGQEMDAEFGVVVTETQVLAHASAVRGRESIAVTVGQGTRDMRVVGYEPATGLVLLESASPIGPPARLAAEPPTAGTLVVAAASWQGQDVTVPLFVTTVGPDRYGVTAGATPLFHSMPFYTLEGELVGIISRDGGEWQAFPAAAALPRLLARAAKGERQASIGVAFQELTPPLHEAFGEGGALISDVVEGGPADLAGVQPGDVLVRIGEVDVASVDAAVTTINTVAVGTVTTLDVRRAGRRRSAQVTPSVAHRVAWLAGAERSGSVAPEAGTLFPRTVLEASHVPGDARVLSVNGRVVSNRAEIDRELRRGGLPLRVLLDDGEKQFFVAVAPGR